MFIRIHVGLELELSRLESQIPQPPLFEYIHVHIYTHTYIYTHIYIYTYVYTYTRRYIYIYI